jgi:hypothetical protein
MKKSTGTFATLFTLFQAIGCAGEEAQQIPEPSISGPQVIVRATAGDGINAPDGLEARVMWLQPTEDAKDSVIEGDASLQAFITGAQASLTTLPSTIALGAALPARDVRTTQGDSTFAQAVVIIATRATLNALSAGESIPADAFLGLSNTAVVNYENLPAIYLDEGYREGLQLLSKNPDQQIVDCHNGNNTAFAAALAVCEACEAEHIDATEDELEEYCGDCQDYEVEVCTGPLLVHTSLDQQIDVTVTTAEDVLNNQINGGVLSELVRLN